MAKEALFVNHIFKTDSDFEKEKKKFINQIKLYLKKYTEEELASMADIFFDEWWKDEIDFDYLMNIGTNFEKYENKIIKKVNKYAENFEYKQMDVIDQALFILWYTEWMQIQTPKEILLNELVELSKRYCDEWSSKLINGIMHKVIAEKK